MKKLVLFLGVVYIMLACKGSNQQRTINVKIGDKGPGGGIVFHIEGDKAWEISDKLGDREWADAKALCKEYRGGDFDDWYLPSKDELSKVYHALAYTRIIKDSDMYWSSSLDSKDEAFVMHFSDGNPYSYLTNSVFGVRAVRNF